MATPIIEHAEYKALARLAGELAEDVIALGEFVDDSDFCEADPLCGALACDQAGCVVRKICNARNFLKEVVALVLPAPTEQGK